VPFNSAFVVLERHPLPNEYRAPCICEGTDWEFAAVDPKGREIFLLAPAKGVALSFEMATRKVKIIASEGTRPHQVSQPTAVVVAGDGKIYVGDNRNRRVSVFSPEGKFLHSFLIIPDHWSPLDIGVDSKGNLYLAGLKVDRRGRYNSGDWVNRYSAQGIYRSSFAYTQQEAIQLRLWNGVSANLEIDGEDRLYLAFDISHSVSVHDTTGKMLFSFGGSPSWFVPPPKLPPLVLWREEPNKMPSDFWKSWTPLLKIIYLGNHQLLLVSKTNGLVKGTIANFILDLYSTTGKPLLEGIESNYFPFGVDRGGNLYLISPEGSEILKACWRKRW